jgi:dCMP deaminase
VWRQAPFVVLSSGRSYDAGICAGKSSIASYLVEEHDFKRISLARTAATPAIEKSASNVSVSSADTTSNGIHQTFPDVDSLLDFVTLRWRERWVTTDIWSDMDVDALMRRPFFLLVSVDAPVSVRWQRFKDRCAASQLTPPTLEEFVLRNDEHLFAHGTGLSALFQRAQLKLLNSTPSIDALRHALRSLNLTNEARLRPSWDQYFMQLADLAAHRCNCMKRRVGCCIVREKRVISTGYNGTPRGMTNCNEGGCKLTCMTLLGTVADTPQVLAATAPQKAAPASPPASACTPKKTLSSKPAAIALARMQSSTATPAPA